MTQYVPDIESIMVALQELLETTTDIVPSGNVKTVTRIWQPWEQVSKLAQPGIVIVEPKETVTDRRGQQPSIKLNVLLVCYIQVDPADLTYPPNTRINSFLEAIRASLLPKGGDLAINAQTLGGRVSNVYLEGTIVKDAGIIDNQGSILIPVTVLIT